MSPSCIGAINSEPARYLQERAFKDEKITFMWNTEVVDILGERKVEGMRVKDVKTQQESILSCDGVFVAIGHQPNTDLFRGQIELDPKGYIITHDETRTNVEGVFVAGDVQDPRYRQAVTAAGSGCKAAIDAERWLQSN